MQIDPVILDTLEEVLATEPQSIELKRQLRQLVANWFSHNASDDDVARLVRRVAVNTDQDD